MEEVKVVTSSNELGGSEFAEHRPFPSLLQAKGCAAAAGLYGAV